MRKLKRYRIVMEHTLVITNTVDVVENSFIEAEGLAAACRWKKYPTNEKDRTHTCVTMSPVKFTTTKIDEE